MVRFPDGMRDQIAADAKKHGRSMNSEIVARLGADPARLSPATEAAVLATVKRAFVIDLGKDVESGIEKARKANGWLDRGDTLSHIIRDWLIHRGFLKPRADKP